MFDRLTFRHGVHPPELKQLTADVRVRRLPYPKEVVLPLSQHTGKPAKPLVRVGDRVERGDLIAELDGWVSSPIHASASGTVTDIGLWPHPDGTFKTAIRIAVEPFSAQIPRPRLVPDWHGLSRDGLLEAIRHAGVVGLGGAAFPTHVKLKPPPDKPIEMILVNGCECEPYLTTDHRSMAEFPERIHLGIRIMMKILGVSKVVIGVERNKPDAIAALERTKPADLDVSILALTVKYPQGAEKMLIKAVTGREVPSGKLPLDVGVVVQNAASVATIAEVFETGLPLVERIVTVTGLGIRKPSNLIVPVGTKLGDLITACGGMTDDAREIVFGGPMMGAPQANLETPLTKGTTGVLVLAERECKTQDSYPCIRCGHCLDACPVFLNPQQLGKLAGAGRYEEMEADFHLIDCMLCGCCSYVCPSNIPLSQQFAAAKVALRQRKTAAA
ncbi:MAG: electron transport complex subunit RsxC [Candidatus Palauibacterales bacterium]|nr:electron transport complex subunit RsxC [Candidatus Palauibacterales bacterium]